MDRRVLNRFSSGKKGSRVANTAVLVPGVARVNPRTGPGACSPTGFAEVGQSLSGRKFLASKSQVSSDLTFRKGIPGESRVRGQEARASPRKGRGRPRLPPAPRAAGGPCACVLARPGSARVFLLSPKQCLQSQGICSPLCRGRISLPARCRALSFPEFPAAEPCGWSRQVPPGLQADSPRPRLGKWFSSGAALSLPTFTWAPWDGVPLVPPRPRFWSACSLLSNLVSVAGHTGEFSLCFGKPRRE